MISNFFVLSPRGDTILSKIYRANPEVGAHERSHTEAFFRKIKFWDGMTINGLGSTDPAFANKVTDSEKSESGTKKDAPPVFIMPDGLSYLHIKRNGLIFGCSTARNISPCTVIEVSETRFFISYFCFETFLVPRSLVIPTTSHLTIQFLKSLRPCKKATFKDCKSFQRLLWNTF